MAKQTKPKFKTLIFENGVSDEAFGMYFDKLPIHTVLSTHRELTKDSLKQVQSKYFAFFPNKIKQLHFQNAIPTRDEWDIIIFGPESYERAGDFARRNPSVKVFVYCGSSSSLDYESEQNFTVCTHDTMKSTITEMYKERYEHKAEDTTPPDGTSETDDGTTDGDDVAGYSGGDE